LKYERRPFSRAEGGNSKVGDEEDGTPLLLWIGLALMCAGLADIWVRRAERQLSSESYRSMHSRLAWPRAAQ